MVNEVLSGRGRMLQGFGEGFAAQRFPLNFGSSIIMTEEGWIADCQLLGSGTCHCKGRLEKWPQCVH